MKVCYICGYWGKLSDRVLGPRPDVYRHAYLYVWAVKHGTYLKDFYIVNKDGGKTFLKKENISLARKRFGSFVERHVLEQDWADRPLIIGVPSSDSIVDGGPSRSSRMVEESMAHTELARSVSDGLRWTKRKVEVHKGGERGRARAVEYLTCTADVRGRNVVLVDDLLTRGGTVLASKDVLEAAGAIVLGAVTVGRTMYDREIKAFGSQSFEIDHELDDFGQAGGVVAP